MKRLPAVPIRASHTVSERPPYEALPQKESADHRSDAGQDKPDAVKPKTKAGWLKLIQSKLKKNPAPRTTTDAGSPTLQGKTDGPGSPDRPTKQVSPPAQR